MLPSGSDSAFARMPDADPDSGTVRGVESPEAPDQPEMSTDPVRTELEELLRTDPRQLGLVFRQLEAGVTDPKEIVAAGAAKNTGAVSNLRQSLASILDRAIPESASISRQAASAIGWFLEAEISDTTRAYLVELRQELTTKAQSPDALGRDAAAVAEADRVLTTRAEELSGVYVYSFLHYIQYPNDEAGRCWLKVGSTNKGAWKRVTSQARQTSMPEDPKLLRIYHSATLTPEEIETRFHLVLDAAGHERSAARHTKAGIEWFSTTLELLDAIALAMGLQVEQLEDGSNG